MTKKYDIEKIKELSKIVQPYAFCGTAEEVADLLEFLVKTKMITIWNNDKTIDPNTNFKALTNKYFATQTHSYP